MALSVVAMIPARAGSQGLPGKNMAPLAGKPLIQHTIEAALGCNEIRHVCVNSDCRRCLKLATQNVVSWYERPGHLCVSTASMLDVVQDFADYLGTRRPDAIAVLYPTYPLRTSEQITAMIEAFEEAGGDRPLIGVTRPKTHPCHCVELDGDRPRPLMEHAAYRRQDFPAYWEVTHQACVLPVSKLDTLDDRLMSPDSVAFEVEGPVVDIDTAEDLAYAEYLLERGS